MRIRWIQGSSLLLTLALGCATSQAEVKETPPAPPPADSARTRILPPEASPISFEQMSRNPPPGVRFPRGVQYAPNGKLITYLQAEGKDPVLTLYAFDPATREAKVLLRGDDLAKSSTTISREEELRRERQRMMAQGITTYRWAERAPVMLIPFAGDIFLGAEGGAVTRLTETPEPEIDPQICATGERVVFVRGSELYVIDVASRRETKLTRGAPEGVTRGQSDFNGQEEFDEYSGYWISARCDKIAYLEVDEREVGTYPVLGFRGGKVDLMMQRYPATGAKNPKVRAGILDVKTQKTTWVKWPNEDERYLGRFRFSPDGKALYAQTLSRDQKRLSLARIDPASGEARELIVETQPTWIDFANMRLLEKSPRLLWTRNIGGHLHLEMRDAVTGAAIAELTSGDWDVVGVNAVDEERGRVLVTATRAGPLERQLYAVPLVEGGEIRRLTEERGVHNALVEREGRGLVDFHAARDRLPRAVVRGADGAAIAELPAPVDPELAALSLRVPEIIEVRGPSGDTLYGSLLKPRTIEPGRRYPVVVMIYGGPGSQTVIDSWSPKLLWNHLADRGVVVFQLDNRGTPGRGVAFETALYDHVNDIELTDQIAGLDELAKLPFVDGSRVGIHGASYGGSMTLLALLKAPERFKVGVAVSPVTDARLYDTGYQERYMGTPEKNLKVYEAANLTKLAPNLRGKLLLIHGMMDENVHFQNAAALIDALVEADKTFDLLVLPGVRHVTRSPKARQNVTRRIVDYLTENL